jgi:peptidoglycan/LPS O-acetylase OafA/YrhL
MSAAQTLHATKASLYNFALGYLRAFLVMLVVAHHAAMAYHPFAPQPPVSLLPQPRWWTAFPVSDPQRWGGFTLFIGLNDVFFMSLMFFLSGLFVWNGLAKKGARTFLRDRLLRLGLPFLVAAAFLAPLAYYPSYLQISGHTGVTGFMHQWLSLGQWPAGPAWFIWLLLAFDCIAALMFVVAPKWGTALGSLTSSTDRKPARFFWALAGVSAIAYVPMALHFSSLAWTAFGPFTFQTSRLFHYLAYFLLGVGAGSLGTNRGLLAPDGALARRWGLWVMASSLALVLTTVVNVVGGALAYQSNLWAAAIYLGFVLSCATTCFAFLALFLHFVKSRSRWFDSLSENSYGIYLVHYAFVSWMQYALLPASLPAVAKAGFVFGGALAMSWLTTATLRRIPAVARVV